MNYNFEGGVVEAMSEFHSPHVALISLYVRTRGGDRVRLDFDGVSTRELEHVQGTKIVTFRELPAPTPYRQYCVVAEPDRMPRRIAIVCRGLKIVPIAGSDAPAG